MGFEVLLPTVYQAESSATSRPQRVADIFFWHLYYRITFI
jgi:hypothetical protein